MKLRTFTFTFTFFPSFLCFLLLFASIHPAFAVKVGDRILEEFPDGPKKYGHVVSVGASKGFFVIERDDGTRADISEKVLEVVPRQTEASILSGLKTGLEDLTGLNKDIDSILSLGCVGMMDGDTSSLDHDELLQRTSRACISANTRAIEIEGLVKFWLFNEGNERFIGELAIGKRKSFKKLKLNWNLDSLLNGILTLVEDRPRDLKGRLEEISNRMPHLSIPADLNTLHQLEGLCLELERNIRSVKLPDDINEYRLQNEIDDPFAIGEELNHLINLKTYEDQEHLTTGIVDHYTNFIKSSSKIISNAKNGKNSQGLPIQIHILSIERILSDLGPSGVSERVHSKVENYIKSVEILNSAVIGLSGKLPNGRLNMARIGLNVAKSYVDLAKELEASEVSPELRQEVLSENAKNIIQGVFSKGVAFYAENVETMKALGGNSAIDPKGFAKAKSIGKEMKNLYKTIKDITDRNSELKDSIGTELPTVPNL